MGGRKIIVRQSVADSIAGIAWFIESKGLVKTAEKFSDSVYDFLEKLGQPLREYNVCRDPDRALLGYKCVVFKKKYTIVFIESTDELLICEFIPSKLIYW
ncbi:hypothetical protein [Dyadobacter luticola]|uniref:Type II toxin-antitoxin system RelE/ParE family toxin n=1 Tax=Dyadobacter luticola TaxID=1979387 RepID=A0A5R9L5I1_9BACT|nr:hypothetical protein [Dyadobacter luticola]TLV03661.1 hypothetical protein FEN17_08685 [Dyadobacter luticola]